MPKLLNQNWCKDLMRVLDQSLPGCISLLLDDPVSHAEAFLKKIDLDTYREFIESLIPMLKSQPAVLDTGFNDVHIVGDLHGSVETCARILDNFLEGGVSRLILLGDYVDRGENALAVLVMVLALFRSFPQRVVLLKGNHESESMNKKYGFADQLRNVFGKNYPAAKDSTLELYDYLSVAAITKQRSLCVHGGIPQTNLSIFDERLKKPYRSIKNKEVQSLLLQLQWNDPQELQGPDFFPSSRGSGINTFNADALTQFLQREDLKRVIRAHEAVRGPWQSIFDGKLLHIFTAEPYFGRIPSGALLHETNEKTTVVDLNLKEIETIL